MRFLLLSAVKDLRRIRRDPIALATWIGIPLMIGAIMTVIFGRGEAKPHGVVLIADQDQTFLSAFVANAYSQGKLGEMLTVEKTPLEEGRRRIGAGDGSALLVIPKGFTAAALRDEPIRLQLITNPSQNIIPGIVRETTAIMVDGAWYLHRLFGDEIRRFADISGSPADALIASSSIAINQRISSINRYIDPPLIEVNAEVSDPGQARQFNIGAAMFPGMVYMAVMFLSLGFGADIWKEKSAGALRRLATTPAPVSGFLAGKLLALAVVFAAVAAVAQPVGALMIGAPARNPVIAVLWLTVSGAGLYLLILFLSTLGRSQRAAGVLTNLAVMLLAMIGGCFFPFEIMPDSFARIGRLTPNGWALTRFREILAGEIEPAALALAFAAMTAVAAVLFLAAGWRLRRTFAG